MYTWPHGSGRSPEGSRAHEVCIVHEGHTVTWSSNGMQGSSVSEGTNISLGFMFHGAGPGAGLELDLVLELDLSWKWNWSSNWGAPATAATDPRPPPPRLPPPPPAPRLEFVEESENTKRWTV